MFTILLSAFEYSSVFCGGEDNSMNTYFGGGYSSAAGGISSFIPYAYNLHAGVYIQSSDFDMMRYNYRFSYSAFSIDNSSHSIFDIYSLSAGVIFLHSPAANIYLTAGLSAQGSYILYLGDKSGDRGDYAKPGLLLSGGMMITSKYGFYLHPEISYRTLPLAGTLLNEFTISLAAVYSGKIYADYANKKQSDSENIPLLASAEIDFEEGRFADAKRKLEGISLTGQNAGRAAEIQRQIAEKEQDYADALKLISGGNRIAALKPLESALPMVEAREEFNRLRKILARDIPALEKNGIRAFEKNNFDECIRYMKMIQSIDPENSAAKLYLPRAEMRKKAMLKLN